MFHARDRGNNQGRKVSLRGFLGHLLHSVTFHVSMWGLYADYILFCPLREIINSIINSITCSLIQIEFLTIWTPFDTNQSIT